ncbi:MAG TPA: right-handed parallel beta-helix repeat-containing protein [Thermoanaerobaculia bacterium]|nr:right-handed parallel beta-helix repeat-containing protein [Thermoanaerobaculia bacterium]
MRPVSRWVVGLCAAIAPLFVQAQSSLVIGGGVFEDRAALAVRSNFVPAANVTVRLYRDGNAAAVATEKTNAGGMYVFRRLSAGTYWVAVDSKTFGPADTWAEQTFGPAGSLCASPDGTARTTWFEGACFSGRGANVSDDASAFATSEHVARVELREPATSVDFAFSFNAVTNTADGERVQGSLRQFIVNGNAVGGPNRMRFVPLERPREQRETIAGVPPRWWSIVLGSALPELRDADTWIDGTAYNFASPASIINANPGRYGEAPTIKPDERMVPRLEKPELELTLTGSEGIVCGARCAMSFVALHGAPNAVVARADARLEHVLVGAAPDVTPSATFGTVGVQVEAGTLVARHLLVTAQTRAGIIVGQNAHLNGERLDISRCGDPASGGAIVLLSDGSSVRTSTIAANGGAGIVIGAPDGSAPANANTIDGCTISGNQAGVLLGPGSSRNVITRNEIMWNRLGGVTSAPFDAPAAAPRENRFSANRFNENGLRPIILHLGAENPNQLARSEANCERITADANGGITAPRLTEVQVIADGTAARVILRGRACPGEIVELYQSYVTSGVREAEQAELPEIRNERTEARETITNNEREMGLPSIGEFNYLGATNTAADGTFEASFPLPTLAAEREQSSTIEETNIWASQVLPGADASDRAFSALAIDAAGNTSEMSVRRVVD